MKGLLDVEKGIVKIVELEKPVCTADTMLVQNIYSGISNGTERNVMMGGTYGVGSFPDKCNYQPVARVVEVGANIKKYKVGDIVYAATFPGHMQYHLLREDDLMTKLPEGFDLLEAALLGTAGVPFHNTMRAEVSADDKVLVMGAGLIGQFAAQAARACGAEVTVADLNEMRLNFAKDLGADHICNLSTPAGNDALMEQGPFDVVYELTGLDQVVEQIIGVGFGTKSLLKDRSRVILTAGRLNVTYNFNAAQEKEIALLHVHHFDQCDLDNVVRLVQKGTIRIKPLITRVVPFAEAPAVFEILRDDPLSLMGTVIDWQGVEE